MLTRNPESRRENEFRKVYDSEEFKNAGNNGKTKDFPHLTDIELTNKCNMACIFCGQRTMKREKGHMKTETFNKILEECEMHRTPVRFIRWGEPFLHPFIIMYARDVKSRGLPLHITNNGNAITERDMHDIVNIETDSIIFSMQGANQEKYEEMRTGGSYEKTCRAIEAMNKIRGDREKPYIHISCTTTNETEEEKEEFKRKWLPMADSVGMGNTNLSLPSLDRIEDSETRERLAELRKREALRKIYRPCKEIWQKLSVDWDGKITCCCGDYDNMMTIGDISKMTLKEAWDSDTLKSIRTLLTKGMQKSFTLCEKCFEVHEDVPY